MIITGAFLAERAASVDGRLHTWGAVWDHVSFSSLPVTEPPRMVLVVLVQAAPERKDHHELHARLLDPDGVEIAKTALDVTLPKGIENGFALATPGVKFAKPGRHLFVIDAPGGHGTSLPLDVRLLP
jgi:hypothetical protein